jgi:hypothetical protein
MKKYKKIIILSVTIILLTLIFFSVFYLFNSKERRFSKDPALKEFYFANKYDPVFYSSDLVENFDFSHYRDYEEKFFLETSVYRYYQERDLKMNLIPHDFLALLDDNSKLLDDFLKKPTRKKAHQLIELQKKTALNYQKNIKDLGKIIFAMKGKDLAENIENIKVNYGFGRKVSVNTIMNDLALIEKNSKELLKKINNRNNILEGRVKFDLSNIKEEKLQEINTDKFQEKIFSQEKARNNLWKFYKNEWNYYEQEELFSKVDFENKVEIKGPYQINISCFEDDKREKHLVYGFYSKESEIKLPYPKFTLADGSAYRRKDYLPFPVDSREESLFSNLNVNSDSKNYQLLTELQKSGELVEDNPFAICTCFFTEKDKINWYLIDFFLKELDSGRDSIFINLEGNYEEKWNNLILQGAEMEKQFIKYPTQAGLENLGYLYEKIYSEIALAEINNEEIPRKINSNSRKIRKYSNFINSKFSVLPRVFDNFYYNPDERKENFLGHYFYNSPLNYALEGSFYYLFYMPWSKSVWVIDEDMKYFEEAGDDSDGIQTNNEPIYKFISNKFNDFDDDL